MRRINHFAKYKARADIAVREYPAHQGAPYAAHFKILSRNPGGIVKITQNHKEIGCHPNAQTIIGSPTSPPPWPFWRPLYMLLALSSTRVFSRFFALSAGDFPKTTQEYFVLAYYCLLLQAVNTFKWIVYVLLAWTVVCIPYVFIHYQWRNGGGWRVTRNTVRPVERQG